MADSWRDSREKIKQYAERHGVTLVFLALMNVITWVMLLIIIIQQEVR